MFHFRLRLKGLLLDGVREGVGQPKVPEWTEVMGYSANQSPSILVNNNVLFDFSSLDHNELAFSTWPVYDDLGTK